MISTQDGPHKIYIKIGFTLLNSRAANQSIEASFSIFVYLFVFCTTKFSRALSDLTIKVDREMIFIFRWRFPK